MREESVGTGVFCLQHLSIAYQCTRGRDLSRYAMTEVSVNSTLVTSAALSARVMNGMCRWSRGTRNKRECPLLGY